MAIAASRERRRVGRRSRSALGALGVLVASLVLAGPALASLTADDLTFQFGAAQAGNAVQVSSLESSMLTAWVAEEEGADGSFALGGPMSMNGVDILSWTTDYKVDPFVTNNITVINPTPFTQSFVATVIVPIPAFAYDTVIASSLGVTVTDTAGGAVTLTNTGGIPIYDGTVNGSTVLPLDPIPNPVTCAPTGCSTTGSNGVGSLAVPAGIATTIGITLSFDLTPFDQAAITSRFEIVPEPGTAVLVATGLGLVAIRRRRAVRQGR